MSTHNLRYVAIIISEFMFIVGLVWYVMYILDRERRNAHRHESIKLFSDVSASRDLAALAARVSSLSEAQVDPILRLRTVRIRE